LAKLQVFALAINIANDAGHVVVVIQIRRVFDEIIVGVFIVEIVVNIQIQINVQIIVIVVVPRQDGLFDNGLGCGLGHKLKFGFGLGFSDLNDRCALGANGRCFAKIEKPRFAVWALLFLT
jgi:hypothetical protein